jgi:hypothetical protein
MNSTFYRRKIDANVLICCGFVNGCRLRK